MHFDLILDNGTILDGTGRDGVSGSVGVRDGRIAAVGDLAGATARARSTAPARRSRPASSTCTRTATG